MKLLNDRVGHDLPLTEAEWAAWRSGLSLSPLPRPLGRGGRGRRGGSVDLLVVRGFDDARARVLLSLFVVWCSVFLLVVDRAEMPRIMAGMYQMDSSSLVVVCGSGSCKVGFTCDYAPRSMFPSVDDRPKMLDIMPVRITRTVSSTLVACLAGFAGDSAHRAALLSLSSGPRCSVSWSAGPPLGLHHGRYGPEVQLRRYWWHVWLVLLVILHLALCFSRRQAQDALHHGRYAPEGQLPEAYRKIELSGTCPVIFSTAPSIWQSMFGAVA